ncbi:short-subunit dehydrogenase [Streptomyces sp. KhCrAH-43]|uniref:oxidoreductase n=1 Tax=unclassified Streptomyces TaxID=2593676 RepID=UPI000374AE29|nr:MULTISPECIES: oxidoreductase [unclassified Streptomyces]MYS33222.1 SDR family NAD(P)-dependent oxidoreductase [Streptomyces sp. SID4920]MYX67579.1 SDR family NAD(P)-dependent oxidoreductase [Streptomyces sp. SID8373]RAJ57982.1 short-subunit dehydrogenase [Streptomyces sp. KhCrAH-43]
MNAAPATPSHDNAPGRVWLITGASSGFGRSLAAAALAAGDTVVATARRPEALDDLVAAHPDRAVAVQLDVTDTARIADVVADTVLWYGRIDVVVNNAGMGLVGAVEETGDRELRDLMDLHFFGPAALVRAVLPHMRRNGSGAVVQMSSMGGRFTFPGVGGYSATKFALEGLSEALAAEVAPHGIKVLIVEPGSFRTGFAGGGALRQSAPLDAYADSVGPVRTGLPDSDGKQEGDPDKAAAAILTALAAEDAPLRLPLGNDATDAVLGALEAARTEVLAWEKVSRSTGFDD